MGLVSPELSLDFRPTFVPKTISNFLKEMSMIGNMPERMSKLDNFVKRLEDEMRKIDAFKRELPLCMLLVNDAILVLKEESLQCATPNNEPVLEEFIPMKKECDEDQESNRDKKNWMSSVQLWNCDTNATSGSNRDSKFDIKRTEKETDLLVMEDPFDQSCRTKNGGRVCMPIKGYGYSTSTQMISVKKEDKSELPSDGLSLKTPGIKSGELASNCFRSICDRQVSIFASKAQSSLRNGPQQQGARKQRRCWSPELHHLFTNALQQLGGAQVATPKQIRDLMQVDGLTNDEVKSHLQKYRLHTRKLPATTTSPGNQSLAVLGGLWMSQDPHGESSNVSNSQSGSPQGPLQSVGIGGTSTTGGGSMEEDDEDTKSEIYSCKSQSEKPVKEYV